MRHEAPEELLAYEGVRASLEALLPYTGMWAAALGGREQPCQTPWSPDSPVLPRAALPAAWPDTAGGHLPGLPVAQHEAAHPPHRPRSSLKHIERCTFPPRLLVSGLCLTPGARPQPWLASLPLASIQQAPHTGLQWVIRRGLLGGNGTSWRPPPQVLSRPAWMGWDGCYQSHPTVHSRAPHLVPHTFKGVPDPLGPALAPSW